MYMPQDEIIKMSQLLFSNLNPEYVIYRKDIKYKTQVGQCVLQALKKRGYTRGEDSYDIFWVQKEGLDSFYANHRVMRDQRLNHYRTYYEVEHVLSRSAEKITLIEIQKNTEEIWKDKGRTNKQHSKLIHNHRYNFLPLTYHLPIEYAIFSDEFKRLSTSGKPNIWIMKPTARCQGRGIFLINKLAQIQQWAENPDAEAYICQKYIQNPLLLGHKKFDLRLYVLCTSYRPLTIYIYRQGFARFTHYRYDETNISSNEVHLTNVAIQKHSAEYSKFLGGKWILSDLKIYLLSKFGEEAVNTCFYQIKNLIIKTLRGVTKIMSNQTNCFELYGFDVMLDSSLKPWLIEVNGSPSMRANTKKDRDLKVGVIDDLLTVLDLQKILSGNEDCLGGFDLVCKKDVNYEVQYYSGSKVALLGCKLQREKAYRALASSLNSYHKKNRSIQPHQSQQSPNVNRNRISQIDSPTKKFSVRKPRRIPSIVNTPQSTKRESQQGQQIKLIKNEEATMVNSVSIVRQNAFRKSIVRSGTNSPVKNQMILSLGTTSMNVSKNPSGILNPQNSSISRRRN